MMRCKRAVEEARKRKAKLKYLIEKAVKGSTYFVGALAADGLTLFTDPEKGLCVKMTDNDGKERSYSMQKDLGIDMNIIPPINITPPGTSKAPTTKVTASPTMNKPSQSSPLKSKSKSPGVANIKKLYPVAHAMQNMRLVMVRPLMIQMKNGKDVMDIKCKNNLL